MSLFGLVPGLPQVFEGTGCTGNLGTVWVGYHAEYAIWWVNVNSHALCPALSAGIES